MISSGASHGGSSRFRPLAGLQGLRPIEPPDEASAVHPGMVATYRLRVIALGALLLLLVLPGLLVYMALPGHTMTPAQYGALLFAGLLALAALFLLQWDRLLLSQKAKVALYLWSLFALLLVNLGVYFDGGATSPVALLIPALVLFFAIAHDRLGQLLLFVAALAGYLAAITLSGSQLTAADLYLRIFSTALLGVIGYVVAGWLTTEMLDRARTRNTADQRAGMLDTVARAARRVSSLDASLILGGALSGAMELGAYECEVWLLDREAGELQLQKRIAIEAGSPNEATARSLFRRVQETGDTEIAEERGDRLVACLLHLGGGTAGILLVKVSEIDSRDQLIIECLELLAAQVSAGLDVARNVAERRGLEERLAHWAFHDSLTDLPNRVLFADRLELALARTQRDASKIAVLFLDLDGFKAINDSLGHSAGDELLTKVAKRINTCLRPNDTLARYGGDEFVVLVEQIEDEEAALAVARRILESLAKPMTIAETELVVRTSIGIAMTTARSGADSDVMRRADIAMYEAKAAGGSRFVLSHSPHTDSSVLRHRGEAS